ncbi:hypothetical protein FGE12_25965 [Aggregicoccus sp. 17bor-14]|uniref:CotH kinase family protein n=1 Tax=Myxococcaceae TaxID=31 RepID=UPI00129D2047|nr:MULTISPECIES: CotH kinase family protein [Myxococcaceae]MBF5045883.1 CotH kinase family protein [Simulacricoccus sp. 17bor-14]MRI91617.1 hypothetical protein [Aggregicoccus sp. 17bor-14]
MGARWLRNVVGAAVLASAAAACGGGGGVHTGGDVPPTPAAPSAPDAGSGQQTPDGGPPDAGPVEEAHRCDPTAGEARWVLEGEPVSATVSCATGLTGAAVRFSITHLPAGATWDAASATLHWTPTRDQAAVYLLTLREESTGETGTLKVGVADNGGAKVADPMTYTEELGLPVVHLFFDAATGLSAGGYRPVQVVYRGHRYTAEAQYRGATSSTFPKRSLTLKFPDGDLFNEPVFGDGFTDRKRVVLVTTFNENSYLRSRLAFDLWNRMSPEHVQIHTYSAVLYMNGSYKGLFTVADHVDKRMLQGVGMDKDSDLFKAVLENANFSRLRQDGTPKDSLHEDVEKKEGSEGAGAWATYDGLVAWVSDADAGTFRTGFAQKLNAQDYADWWIFNTLIVGTDSMAKNSYHAYDPKAGGPWRYIPWDLDATFGQNFDTTRIGPTARLTFEGDNLLFRKMLQEPSIAGPMRERYRTLLRTQLSESVVQGLIDQYVKETAPSARKDWAAWQEWYHHFGDPTLQPYDIGYGNFPKWHERTDFNTYEGEVQYVRDWVHARWGSLQSGGVP